MALKKNSKDRTEASFWKPLISGELLFRIKKIVEETGLSPSALFLKWVLQEESLMGMMRQRSKPVEKPLKTQPKASQQKSTTNQGKSEEIVPIASGNSEYRKTLAQKAQKLKKEGMSLKKIAEIFNEEKVATVSGTGKWFASSIANLLKSDK